MSWIVNHGDCLDPVTGLASLADKSVDHVITDPPYEAEAHTKGRRIRQGHDSNGRTPILVSAPLSFDPITADDRERFAIEAARIARRWIVVFCQAEAVAKWRDALEAAGAVYKRAAVWVKPDAQPQLTGDRPGVGYESMVIAHAPGRSRWNGGGKVGVYVFNKNNDDPVRTGHPTQKPLALMESLVRDFTDPGEIICDPFAGSGTTGVACKRLGRNFIGFEREEKWATAAQKRIDKTQEQLRFFESLDPVATPGQAESSGSSRSALGRAELFDIEGK